MPKEELKVLRVDIEKQMYQASKALEFTVAAKLKKTLDKIDARLK